MLETCDSSKRTRRAQGPQPEARRLERRHARVHSALGQTYLPLLAFVAVTMVAVLLQHVNFMAAVPEGFRPLLGEPPAPKLTSIALSAYFVSSVVACCHGIFAGTSPRPPWVHLALLTGFYFLYFCADALRDNLLAVFVAGLILLALESLRSRFHHLRTRSGAPAD